MFQTLKYIDLVPTLDLQFLILNMWSILQNWNIKAEWSTASWTRVFFSGYFKNNEPLEKFRTENLWVWHKTECQPSWTFFSRNIFNLVTYRTSKCYTNGISATRRKVRRSRPWKKCSTSLESGLQTGSKWSYSWTNRISCRVDKGRQHLSALWFDRNWKWVSFHVLLSFMWWAERDASQHNCLNFC